MITWIKKYIIDWFKHPKRLIDIKLERIQKRVIEKYSSRVYDKNITFYELRVDGNYGCFSNISPDELTLDCHDWKTVYHYIQFQKCYDYDVYNQIRDLDDAKEINRIMEFNKKKIRKDWDKVKLMLMIKTVYAKIIQHRKIREKLLSTGEDVLIKCIGDDDYWSCNIHGVGNNMLGKVLMGIRDDMNRNGTYDELDDHLKPLWIQYPNIYRESINWRMGTGELHACDYVSWWRSLSNESKKRYIEMYPEHKDWEGWYSDLEKYAPIKTDR